MIHLLLPLRIGAWRGSLRLERPAGPGAARLSWSRVKRVREFLGGAGDSRARNHHLVADQEIDAPVGDRRQRSEVVPYVLLVLDVGGGPRLRRDDLHDRV